MKLGEIKLEALRLMFTNYSEKLDLEHISTYYEDEKYGQYLQNMTECINRAIDRINSAGVLSEKSYTVTKASAGEGIETSSFFNRYALASLISDYHKLVRVVKHDARQIVGNYNYLTESESVILLAPLNENESYIFIYSPKVGNVNALDDEDDVVIEDGLARVIPFYIKGDLFQEDEPQLAADAKNQFEQYIATYKKSNDGVQNSVKTVYGVNW